HTCGALENDHQLGSVSQRLVMDERIRGHIGLALPIWIEIEHYELYGLESVRHLEILPFLSGAHEIRVFRGMVSGFCQIMRRNFMNSSASASTQDSKVSRDGIETLHQFLIPYFFRLRLLC